jgi:hypothetical protein
LPSARGGPALCQTKPGGNAAQLPDYVLYDSFLFRVKWLSGQADKLASQGMNDGFSRTMVQREVGLTDSEAALLNAVAADWWQKNSAIVNAVKAALAVGAQAGSQQLQSLQNQRIRTVQDHISQLQAGLGPPRFLVLDAFVRQAPTVTAPTALPPHSVPARE